jgi:hypothetical protein
MHEGPLTDEERASLLRLLPPDGFPGVEEYRAQFAYASVVARRPCGCPTVDLRIDAARAPRSWAAGTPLLPLERETGEGEEFKQLIIFACDGWLESLELVYYSEEPAVS